MVQEIPIIKDMCFVHMCFAKRVKDLLVVHNWIASKKGNLSPETCWKDSTKPPTPCLQCHWEVTQSAMMNLLQCACQFISRQPYSKPLWQNTTVPLATHCVSASLCLQLAAHKTGFVTLNIIESESVVTNKWIKREKRIFIMASLCSNHDCEYHQLYLVSVL